MSAYLSVDSVVGLSIGRADASVFRGAKVSRFEEQGFCFAV